MTEGPRRTTCSRDCPDACSILVTVEDGRAVSLRGDPDDPITHGFLCERTNLFLDRQYAPDRFLTPMLRQNGELSPVSWEQALDVAAEKMLRFRRESGPAAILHYKSGGSLGILKVAASHLFERFGPVSVKRGDICSGAGEAAQERDFGLSESHDMFDLENSKTILLWGKNPHVSATHLIPVLNRARRNGATVIGIDPVRTEAARVCDHFISPRPGADFALAMAIARWLFDNDAVDPEAATYCDNMVEFREMATRRTMDEWSALADLAPDETRMVAELYGRGSPAAILVGWGLGRRRNGSTTVRALDALGAVTGNLGIAGGGVSFCFGRKSAFDLDFVDGASSAPRTFSEARLGPEVLAADDPPVRMIWVTAANPVSMLPDSGAVRAAFEKADFNVVVETHPTDTTDVADLVLPTLTLLEDDDLFGAFGNHMLRVSTPAISPPAGPRHELHILQGLAGRLGLEDEMAGSVEDWKRRVTRRLEEAGVGIDVLNEGAKRNPFAAKVLFEGRRFPTATGRVDLMTEEAGKPPAVDDLYPMTLLAVSTSRAQSSQWARPLVGPVTVRVHPDAAAGFTSGDRARLESRRSALTVTIEIDDSVRPDVALLPKGGMLRGGHCANLLIEAVETDDGGGAAYYDEPVRLVAE